MFLFPNQTAEIIALLYEATQGPPLPLDEPPALNPTGTSFLTKIHCLAHWLIGGVKGKQPPPLNGLQYKKDPSRPGSGVFIAHSTVAQKNYEDLLPGVLVPSSDSGSEGEESVVERSLPVVNDGPLLHLRYIFLKRQPNVLVPTGSQIDTVNTSTAGPMPSSSMVNITPLGDDRPGGSFPNMNPVMNSAMASTPGNVQVMNVLDEPHASTTLEQFAMTDTGFLEGIPGGMFDWGVYCPRKHQKTSLNLFMIGQWDNFFSRFNASVADGGGGGGMLSGYRQQHQPSADQQQSQANQNATGEHS